MVHLSDDGERLVFQEDESLPGSALYPDPGSALSAGNGTYGDVRTWRPLDHSKRREDQVEYDTLGPDTIGDAFTPDYLYPEAERDLRAVKAVILDQTVVAGVGNIYADEALFLASIRPSRTTRTG